MKACRKSASVMLTLASSMLMTACGGGGGGSTATATAPAGMPMVQAKTAIAVLPTSYANTKMQGLAPFVAPSGVDPNLRTFARADFRQVAAFDLLMVTTAYTNADNEATAKTKPAQLAFYKIQDDGTYVKDNSFLTSTDVCYGPSKVIVADFNGDSIPDMFIACTGYDGGTFPGDKNWVVLSDKATGKFTPKMVSAGAQAFYHSAAAADLDGDGKIDVMTIDPGQGMVFLKNDGAGNFTATTMKTAAPMQSYYQVDITDVNGDGKLDILAGGMEDATNPAPTMIYLGGNLTAFSTDLTGAAAIAIPPVTGIGNVGDFLVDNGRLFVARTQNGGSSSRGLQAINLSDLSRNCPNVLNEPPTAKQINRLIPTKTGVVTESAHDQIPEVPFTVSCGTL